MTKFIETIHCKLHVHCKSCRKGMLNLGEVFEFDGVCPEGFTLDTIPEVIVVQPEPRAARPVVPDRKHCLVEPIARPADCSACGDYLIVADGFTGGADCDSFNSDPFAYLYKSIYEELVCIWSGWIGLGEVWMDCSDSVWTLRLYDSAGYLTAIYTSPNMDGCPPLAGWELQVGSCNCTTCGTISLVEVV